MTADRNADAACHLFMGKRMGAPLFLASRTSNFAGLVPLAFRPGCGADCGRRIGPVIWSMRNRSLRQIFLLLVRFFEPVFKTRRP
jgi:hypothetical protein